MQAAVGHLACEATRMPWIFLYTQDLTAFGGSRSFLQYMVLFHVVFMQLWPYYREWCCSNFSRSKEVLESVWPEVDGHPLLNGNPIRLVPFFDLQLCLSLRMAMVLLLLAKGRVGNKQ